VFDTIQHTRARGIAQVPWRRLAGTPTVGANLCDSGAGLTWIGNEHAIAFPDAHPVTDGHTLVAPRKHVSTINELDIPEQRAIWDLVAEVRQRLLTGLAAGQIVTHAHVHVIPRRAGDVPEPRDGIRWIIADNAPNWNKS